jgi:hypothetical protein
VELTKSLRLAAATLSLLVTTTAGAVTASASPSPLAAQAAGATLAWQPLRTPAVLVPIGSLASVSCPDKAFCMAVGQGSAPSGQPVPLAEAWASAAWQPRATTEPGVAAGASLSAVSCASALSCVAVGHYSTAAGLEVPLAELWTGGKWRLRLPPAPPAATTGSSLAAVSCYAGGCVAVGAQTAPKFATPLAYRWSGSAWSQLPAAAEGALSRLAAVSCVTSTACVAVGNTGAGTLAEAWNGSGWRLQSTPAATGAGSRLVAIACPTATACEAVGAARGGGTLAEGWNGSRWTTQSMPVAARTAALAGISCQGPSLCSAVGSRGSALPLAEAWDGSAWALQRPADPDRRGTALVAVSCHRRAPCMAVGTGLGVALDGKVTIAEESTGTAAGAAWAALATPTPPGPDSTRLAGASCLSSSACWAVGGYSTASGWHPLVEAWDGRSWALQAAPLPSGLVAGFLSAISCVAPAYCMAVGSGTTLAGVVTLAEIFNGRTWGVHSTPSLSGAKSSALSSVACTSPGRCIAVGDFSLGGSAYALSEQWTGTNWILAAVPGGGASSSLSGITCNSGLNCLAVGSTTPANHRQTNLADSWNGHTWTLMTTPQPSPSGNALAAISCLLPSDCLAVGRAGGLRLEVLHWDGSSWSAELAPEPPGTRSAALGAVSCTTVTRCVATGSFLRSAAGPAKPLAEHFDGTAWALQGSHSPAGALTGLSCAGPFCIAVGSVLAAVSGYPLALVEAYSAS